MLYIQYSLQDAYSEEEPRRHLRVPFQRGSDGCEEGL